MLKKIFAYQENPKVREKLMFRITKFVVIGAVLFIALTILLSWVR